MSFFKRRSKPSHLDSSVMINRAAAYRFQSWADEDEDDEESPSNPVSPGQVAQESDDNHSSRRRASLEEVQQIATNFFSDDEDQDRSPRRRASLEVVARATNWNFSDEEDDDSSDGHSPRRRASLEVVQQATNHTFSDEEDDEEGEEDNEEDEEVRSSDGDLDGSEGNAHVPELHRGGIPGIENPMGPFHSNGVIADNSFSGEDEMMRPFCSMPRPSNSSLQTAPSVCSSEFRTTPSEVDDVRQQHHGTTGMAITSEISAWVPEELEDSKGLQTLQMPEPPVAESTRCSGNNDSPPRAADGASSTWAVDVFRTPVLKPSVSRTPSPPSAHEGADLDFEAEVNGKEKVPVPVNSDGSSGGLDFGTMSTSQLRVALNARGLSTNGKKPQLQRRLAAAEKQEHQEN